MTGGRSDDRGDSRANGARRGRIVVLGALLRPGQQGASEEQGRQVRSGQDSERQSGQAGYRLGRLWAAADMRKVPLRTIIAAIAAVASAMMRKTTLPMGGTIV